MKILVIDDIEAVKNEICDFFYMENYEVYQASDGLEGLALAIRYTPDVIVSDVMIPLINGIQFYKFLKMNPVTENIPIILFTGNTDEKKKEFALKLGVKHYFIKPFCLEYMLKTVRNLMSN